MTLIPPAGLSSLFRAAPAAVPALGDLHSVACCCFHLIHLIHLNRRPRSQPCACVVAFA
jgi:hypothetical protein